MKTGFFAFTAAVARGLHRGDGSGARLMRAARIHGYGGAEVLRVESTPVPTAGPGQVRVRIVASGVNPLDWKLREGWLKDIAPRALPFTLGSDLSGVVDQVGAGVSELGKGWEVFGRVGLQSEGTFAEYAVAVASDLVAKPKYLSHLEAAALPLAGSAARAALAGLREGDRVLILGGAGGVGHLAVQLAKLYGAWVAATASRSNLEFVSSLGADAVVERDRSDLSSVLAPVDLVIDTVGYSPRSPPYGMFSSAMPACAQSRPLPRFPRIAAVAMPPSSPQTPTPPH